MSDMDFCFQNADTKGRNLDYVLWLGMVMSVLIDVTQQNQCYSDICCHLPKASLSIPNKVYRVYVKKNTDRI